MAVTSYATGDALAAKLWARDLSYEVRKGLEIAPLIGKGPNSIIQEKTELKAKGDQVTVGLRTRLTGSGKTENQALEGSEEPLSTFSDAVKINELNHAVRVKGEDSIDQQRVLFNMREEAKAGLADWYAERLSLMFFAQASGYTGTSMTYRGTSTTMSTVYLGLNTVTAPSTARKIFAVGTTDQAVEADSTKVFNLNLIDKAVEAAKTANPKIRPVKVDGDDMYVCYLHPYQVYDLRTNASDGQWMDFTKAAYMGRGKDNPIFTGAIGMYNGVVLRENEDVVPGVHSTSLAEQTHVRRALLLGAQSVLFGQSSQYSKNSPYKWVEKTFDYDREIGVSAQGLIGMKKTIFNSTDFGVITISTYAAAH